MRKAPRRGLRLARVQFLLFLLVCFLLPDVIADDLSVSNSSSGRRWKLDHAPAVGDPTHMVEFGTGRRAFAREA